MKPLSLQDKIVARGERYHNNFKLTNWFRSGLDSTIEAEVKKITTQG